jgi:hypothetical protein
MTPTKYNGLNELLAEFSDLTARLVTIEASVNKSQIAAARPMLPDHANTTARLSEIESKLRTIAVENPELFPEEKKTHNTPFGAISFRSSTSLDFDDEEKVVLKIIHACDKERTRADRAGVPPLFTEDSLLRKRLEPDLEALEKLTDAELALFGIERKTTEKFSVKPLEVKADKLLKKAEKPEAN